MNVKKVKRIQTPLKKQRKLTHFNELPFKTRIFIELTPVSSRLTSSASSTKLINSACSLSKSLAFLVPLPSFEEPDRPEEALSNPLCCLAKEGEVKDEDGLGSISNPSVERSLVTIDVVISSGATVAVLYSELLLNIAIMIRWVF